MRESIDPGDINNLGIKFGAIGHPQHPFGPVVVFAMLTRWNGHGARIVGDSGDNDDPYYEYRDVTADVLADYNEYYSGLKALDSPEWPLKYTGASRKEGT